MANLAEEEGREGTAHAALWSRFAAALDARPEEPLGQTRASADALSELCSEGEIEALAALWVYELQTARVARTKREGLTQRYGVNEIAFFTLPNFPRADVVPTDTANVLWTQPEDSEIFASFRDDVPASRSLFDQATAAVRPGKSGVSPGSRTSHSQRR